MGKIEKLLNKNNKTVCFFRKNAISNTFFTAYSYNLQQ